jgi:L-fuconolactonase
VLDIYGPGRLMFASDWPMLVRFATYGDWVRAVERYIAERQLSAAEIANIFAGNALRAHPRLGVTA